MAGTDQIVLNTRERAASSDMNDLQSLKDRTFLDSLLHRFALRTYAAGVQPTEVSQPCVLGGLEVLPSGNDLIIQPGVLLQDSASLSPAPGTLDSSYRWAALRANQTIANPAPGSDTWYLLEVQMSEVVALNTLKDIWNTGTGAFVPTAVDKRTERTISAQLVAGTTTNLPLPSGGDWIVIAGVLVPTGGGPIPAANIIDMRPLADDIIGLRPAAVTGKQQVKLSMVPTNTPIGTKELVIGAEGSANGRHLWLDTTQAGINPVSNLNAIRQVGTNPQAVSTLSYLYLAPVQDAATRALFARNAYANGALAVMNGNCLLVWTTTAPGADRTTNGSTMQLPAPFSNYTVPVGAAVCIGAMHTDAGGTLVTLASGGENKILVPYGNPTPIPNWGDSATPTGGADTLTMSDVPACARSIDVLIQWTRDASGSQGEELFVQPVGGSIGNRWYLIRGDWDTSGAIVVTLPAVTSFELEFDGTTPPSNVEVALVGYAI